MKPSEYIIQCLERLKSKDIEPVAFDGELADRIYQLLMSKKFRKYSVNPEYREHMLSAIKINIAKNEPIKLVLVFGGYKLWRLPESPEVDWAEVFSLIYYTKWVKQILAIYKPGVWFDFYSDDVILEIMDNVPKEDTERYISSFRKLLEFMKAYAPENMRFTLNRVGDHYKDYDDFKKDLEQCLAKKECELMGMSLTPEQAAAVELNVKLKSGQAETPQWRERVHLIHEAYVTVSERRPYYRVPDKIMVITRQLKNTIAVGTTKRSVVKFWVGAGVLEKAGDAYVENIFSPKQLESAVFTKEPIDISGLDSKNFKEIRIVDKTKV